LQAMLLNHQHNSKIKWLLFGWLSRPNSNTRECFTISGNVSEERQRTEK
jgi:hypothetical protein